LQRGGRASWARFGSGRAGGLVCSCCCVRSATAYGSGGCSLLRSCGSVASCPRCFSRSGWPHKVCHSETALMTARLCWRMLVGGKFGGARWIVLRCGFLGVGRNPCRFGRHRRGDACGRRPSFFKGVGFTPYLLPSAYQEKS
jgi:hypothetical protein